MGFNERIAAGNKAMLKHFGTPAAFDIINSITVIFSQESEETSQATGEVFLYHPEATCNTSDVPKPINKTLKVKGVRYKIIGAADDGSGMTVLTLSKD